MERKTINLGLDRTDHGPRMVLIFAADLGFRQTIDICESTCVEVP